MCARTEKTEDRERQTETINRTQQKTRKKVKNQERKAKGEVREMNQPRHGGRHRQRGAEH